MKKVLGGAIILCFLSLLLYGKIYALSANQQATFTVSVSSIFELSIDQGLIDFGKMSPGQEKSNMPPQGIVVASKTNNGNPWYLKINASSPFTSGDNIIPYQNFRWHGWTDGNGSWYGTGNNVVRNTPSIAYSSGLAEESNLPQGTTNHFKFKLAVPKDQAPGLYTGVVKFTMTE